MRKKEKENQVKVFTLLQVGLLGVFYLFASRIFKCSFYVSYVSNVFFFNFFLSFFLLQFCKRKSVEQENTSKYERDK